MSFTAFQIPANDTMPAEGMIEWLHLCGTNWDGDPSGINIELVYGSDEWELARPGDWIIEYSSPLGVEYLVVNQERFDLIWQHHNVLADIPDFTVEEAVNWLDTLVTVNHSKWYITRHEMDDSPIVASQDIDGLIFCASGELYTSPVGASWVAQ